MMETDSKKLKLDETQDDGYYPCSYLPECIMSHILSFLPTEDSVRASFVSKSWKSLLSPLSVIDLDFDRFSRNSCLDDQKKRFARFVEHMLLTHKGRHLEELRLAFDISGFEEDHSQIDEWSSFAMTSDSTTLDLDFWGGREGKDYPDDDDRYYCLPESTLWLQSVEVLRLKYCIFVPSLDVIFMSIKILVLTAVSLPDESVHVLIESCPCLEELHLIACIVPECFFLQDLETTLKCLVVDSCKGRDLCMFVFNVDIPSLLRFKYVGGTGTDFRIGNSRNISEAEIKIDDDDYDFSATEEEAAYDDARLCAMLHEVLSNMDNVDSLTISKSCLQFLAFDYDKTMEALIAGDESHEKLPPPLPKLKHLSLELSEGHSYMMNFACLLKSSPNLETLCIDQSMDELIDPDLTPDMFDHEEEMFWRTYLLPPEFLRNLKKVEIKGFEGRIDEIFLLKIILDHSLVLKEMVIYKAAMKSRYASMKQDGNKKKEVKLLKANQQAAIEKLLSFRRGSSRARILLLHSAKSDFQSLMEFVMMEMEMDSKKLKQLDDHETQEDGCSYLPECIISHILSFLPTEDSTRASFVSKTWKSLLYPLSILDLDFERFSKNSSLNDQKKRFAQFVECVMLINKGRHMEELRLAFDISRFDEDHHPQIGEWVSFAMTSDSTTLDLDFWGGREGNDYPDSHHNYYCLPECILPLQSVEVLRLKYCSFIPSQDMIFMSIKILALTAVSLLPDDSVHDLIKNCPCLEELHLIECIVPEDLIIEDSETKLKCLVFDSCKGGDISMYFFDVDIPSLLRFKYVGDMMPEFSIGNSRNLTEAEIQFDDEYCDYADTDEEAADDDDVGGYCAMLRQVLSNMDNLDTLTISKSFLQVLTFDYDKTIKALIAGDESNEKLPPPLPNLKHLSLKSFEGRNYSMNFACLLKSAPNLETLCIDQSMDELIDPDLTLDNFDNVEEMFWRTYLFPPESLRHVKKVEIKGFEGRIDEMFLLKILLDHSLVLEEMVIYKAAMKSRYASMKQDGNKKKEVKLLKANQQAATERLLTFRRGSSRARLLLL